MTMEKNTKLGAGGTGFHGKGPGTAETMVRELQLSRTTVLAGDSAATDIPLPGSLVGDTLISVIEFDTGVPVDVSGEATIDSDGNLQLSTTDSTGNTLLVTWAPKPDRTEAVAGLDVDTNIAVAGIQVGDTLKNVYSIAATVGKEITSYDTEAAITSAGNIQLTTTDTTGLTLFVEWSPADI